MLGGGGDGVRIWDGVGGVEGFADGAAHAAAVEVAAFERFGGGGAAAAPGGEGFGVHVDGGVGVGGLGGCSVDGGGEGGVG